MVKIFMYLWFDSFSIQGKLRVNSQFIASKFNDEVRKNSCWRNIY